MTDLIQTMESQMAQARQRIAELEGREAEHQRTEQVQAALYHIADTVGTAEDMHQFYAAMHHIVGELMFARNFYIALWDEAAQVVNVPYIVDEFDASSGIKDLQIPMARFKRGLTGYVIRTEQSLHCSKERQAELTQQGEIETVGTPPVDWLGVPLKTDEGIIGVLVVQSYTENATYTDQDLTLLNFIGQHIATALGRARLFDKTQRLLKETEERNAELAIINSVQSGLAAKLDMQAIYDMVGDQLRDIFDAQILMIATFDHTADTEQFNYFLEKNERRYPNPRPIDKLRRHLINTRQLVLINENFRQSVVDLGFNQKVEPVPGTELPKSVVFLPLVVGEGVRGYVSLQNIDREHVFGDSDVRLLTTLANSMSIALENARLFAETQRLLAETRQRTAELGTVNTVSQAIVTELELEALIELVGEQIRDAFKADIAYVALHDRQSGMIHFPYQYGDNMPSLVFGEGLTSQIIETGRPLLINQDVTGRYAELDKEQIGKEALSYLGVPVIAGQQVIGVLSVQSTTQEGRFDEANMRLLGTIAANVSAALQNAQLYRETRRQAIEMAALTEVGREILATLELDVVLERIASYARELLHGDDSALFLPEAEGQSFKALVAIGAMATQLKAATVQLGQGILGDVARRGQAEIINDVNNDPRVIQIPGTPEEEQERLLVAPLLADKQVMGLMAVWRIGPRDLFNQDDLNFLTGLARQTVIAITNARLFAEAAAARAEAEQANLAKSAFLATMSHELRTPLNAIIGFTKIVKRKGATVLPEKQTDNLEKVLVSAEHLLGLINTILDIAKIEAGHMDIAPSEFNVEKLADMCAITTQPLLKTGVELAKDIEPDLPLAYSDQDKIKQILLNLLSNAAKFTHEGQVTLRVAGRKTSPYPMAGVGSVVVFNVIDSGIGIYEEDLARIFEEFQQADNSITRQYGGTGLGLSISRKLARLLGGELTATSVPGEGSTFTLAVPLRYQEPVFVA